MQRRKFFKILIGAYSLCSASLFSSEFKNSKQTHILESDKLLLSQNSKNLNLSKLNKLCFIGVGGGGTNILNDMEKLQNHHLFIQLNSDYSSLRQKTSKNKILLGFNEKKGLGCGGKQECGKNLITDDVKHHLKNLTKDMNTLYIVSSLGGGVGSGASPEIIRFLKSLDKEVIVFVTTPFAFEGKQRSLVANNALKSIKQYSDSLTILHNDDLLKNSKSKLLGIKDAFETNSSMIYEKIREIKNS